MMNSQLLLNLNRNLSNIDNLQNQMATGRRINKPSDDPVGISFSLRYRSEIQLNDQYLRNVDSGISWLEYTDEMLDQVNSVFQRVREITVQGATGSNPQEALNIIASEVDQMYEQMVSIANSKFNGKYVFNGEMTDVKPYEAETAGSTASDTGKINFEIGVGVKLPVNVTGNEVFGDPNTANNAFVLLRNLSESLRNGDLDGVGEAIELIDQRMDKLLAVRADIGAKTNRIELAESRLKDISTNLTNLLAKTEDADMAEVIMNITMAENVYQASLAAGSKVIKPSLVDFLR